MQVLDFIQTITNLLMLVIAAYTDGQQYVNHSSKLLAEELNTTYTQQ